MARDPQFTGQATGHSSPALLRHCPLYPRACGSVLREELPDALDQLHGDGLGEREADRALVDLVRCKVVLERGDEAPARGRETGERLRTRAVAQVLPCTLHVRIC